MANIWQILYPYSSSKRLGRVVVIGAFLLMFTYIAVFLRTAADIASLKERLEAYKPSFMGSWKTLVTIFEDQTDWQTLNLFPGTAVMVYSAFLSTNITSDVLILGAIPPGSRAVLTTLQDQVDCQLRSNEDAVVSDTFGTGFAEVDRKSDLLKMVCPYKKLTYKKNGVLTELDPTHVSIFPNSNDGIKTSGIDLRINRKPKNATEYLWNRAVCVLPTDYQVNVIQFLEWLAYQQAREVEQLTIYNMDIGPNVTCIINNLDSYEGAPIAYLLPWHIGGSTRALDVAEADCQYRHMHLSKEVDVADLEDFGVTKKQIRVLKEQFDPVIDEESKTGKIILRGIDLTEKIVASLKHFAEKCELKIASLLKKRSFT